MENKKPLFSVTRKDFIRQTFTVGGHGGSGKDTSNSGVRLIHLASGARGEGRSSRKNSMNEREAFLHLVDSKEFKNWHRLECARRMGQKKIESEAEIFARIDAQLAEDERLGRLLVEEFDAS